MQGDGDFAVRKGSHAYSIIHPLHKDIGGRVCIYMMQSMLGMVPIAAFESSFETNLNDASLKLLSFPFLMDLTCMVELLIHVNNVWQFTFAQYLCTYKGVP